MLAHVIDVAIRRFVLAVTELPTAATWFVVATLFTLTVAACVTVGFRRGFLKPRHLPLTPKNVLLYGLLPFAAPALAEEIVYRVLLLPRADEHVSTLIQVGFVAFSLTLFVVCHPLRYHIVPSKRSLTFTDPTFLIVATILGCGCTAAFLVSESLWPCVLIHYACVVGWLSLLGGAERLDSG